MDNIRYVEIINNGGQVIFAPEAATIVISKGEKNGEKPHECKKQSLVDAIEKALKG